MSMNAYMKRRKRRDLSELVGDDGSEKRKVGRPRKADHEIIRARKPAPESDDFSLSSRDLHRIYGGVSVQWLAKFFRTTRHVVEKKLGSLRPIGSGDYGNPLYDPIEAVAHLVEPKFDLDEYLSSVKVDKLPEKLRETVWNAKLKQQRWEERAGHLWRTETMMGKFGEVLLGISSKLQQIPDRVERLTGLSIEQYKLIQSAVDEVREEIFEQISIMRDQSKTPNQLGEAREEERDELI